MAIPLAFSLWGKKWWRLSDAQVGQAWGALVRSSYSRPVQFRHQLSLIGHVPIDLDSLVLKTLTPQFVMGVFEDLVVEKRLTRQQASAMETCILTQVDSRGEWIP